MIQFFLLDEQGLARAKFLGGQLTHCLCRAPPPFSTWFMYDLEISRGAVAPLVPPQATALSEDSVKVLTTSKFHLCLGLAIENQN